MHGSIVTTHGLAHEFMDQQSVLLFVHGDFSDGLDAWGDVAILVPAPHRVVIVDRPGYGSELAPGARYTIAGDARYVAEAVREMGITDFHLIGHSYGGLVALALAIAEPVRVRSLHLVEPPLLDLLPHDPLVREMDHRVRQIQGEHANRGDEATTAAFFSMVGAERMIERQRGTPTWQRLCGYAARFAANEPAGAFLAAALADVAEAFPVALYRGGRSHQALRAVTEAVAQRLPRATLIEVPEAGHAVQRAGAAFINPLLKVVRDADVSWAERASAPPAGPARE